MMNPFSRRWHRLSLSSQLRFLIMLPLVMVNGLFCYLYLHEAKHESLHDHHHAVQLYARHLMPAVQFALTHSNTQANLQDLIQSASNHPELQAISVYDKNHQLLAYHGAPISLPQRTKLFIAKPKFLDANTLITPIRSIASSPHGWLILKIDPHALKISYYTHLFKAIGIILLSLVLCLLIFSWLNRSIIVPLAKLRRSMRQILKQEYETDIPNSDRAFLAEIEQGARLLQRSYLDCIHDLNHQIEVSTADLQQSLELLEEKNIELFMDKKKIEEKLSQKSQFIANMSHEIRTPMNGILGFIEILLDTPLNLLQKDYVKTIQSSSKNLLTIINDILDYSKLDAGKLNIEHMPINLHHALDEVVALTTPSLNKKDIEFLICLDKNLPQVVLGDGLRLKQILQNLLVNAIKFTEMGHIMIELRLDHETETSYQIKLIVEDTGIGMTPDEKKQLFNPFYQTQSTVGRHQFGSGLGLVICKKLAEAMGGTIEVESRPLEGTVFTTHLLFKKLPAYEQDKLHVSLSTYHSPLKILCIDTHPRSLMALEQTLHALSYTTVNCHELSSLPIILGEHPDIHLVIYHVYDHLRQSLDHILRECPNMPCIIWTKLPIPPDYKTSITLLPHPIQIQKLEEKIQQCTHPLTSHTTQPQAQAQAHQLRSLRMALQHGNTKILVAEDNPVNRLLIETLLSPHCQIILVHDGEQAVELSQQQCFDLIILDLHMPQKSGHQAALHIRQVPGPNQQAPMIFMSANASEINTETLHDLNISKCLQKPIDEATLLQEIIEVTQIHTQPGLDWERCLANLSNNQELAINCLIQFIEELKHNTEQLKKYHQNHDHQAIGDLAHSMKGACGFLAIHRLKELSHTLEQDVYNFSPDVLSAFLEKMYLEMNQVMLEAQRKIQETYSS
jgi:two-component system sensor histidine kinase BarA